MNELITITKQIIGEEEVNAVDARTLWKQLKNKKQFFTNWTMVMFQQNCIAKKDISRSSSYCVD